MCMPGLNHFILLQSSEEAAFCNGEKHGFDVRNSSCLKPQFVYISKMTNYPCLLLWKDFRVWEVGSCIPWISKYLGQN